ncbi:hypothetical protein [Marinisporobacter balticus]|uniref:hypothetical protein n=1 Tax=Marinisporobacter balticus TaxID=2018667 RepID=UPI00104EE294|nr:hypothetical protein [Marinisporobacter balticus]
MDLVINFGPKSMPKLKRYLKKDEEQPIEEIISQKDKGLVLATVKSIEGYVLMSAIVIGLLQILPL